MSAALPLSKITDDEFDQMVTRGLPFVLGRVEIRDGFLHRKSAQYIPHGVSKMRLFRNLDRAIAGAAPTLETSVEISVRFGGGFTPLPDIVVWKRTRERGAIPGANVLLIAEIADTTQADDLGAKRDAYARAGLAEYWAVDLPARTLHRFAGPQDGAYQQAAVFTEGSTVDSLTIPGVSVVFEIPDQFAA